MLMASMRDKAVVKFRFLDFSYRPKADTQRLR